MNLLEQSLQSIRNNNHVKKIGVLTSGGDAPGMNAAIRAVTRAALSRNIKVVGIEEGLRGLWRKRFRKFTAGSVGDILQRGGTILRTARLPEFRFDKAIRDKCYENLKEENVDSLVVIGGDGSFQAANLLSKEHPDLRVVGLPCTIDNDLAYTDFTIGFDTAVNTCVNLINNLRDTMASHDRISVVEVMGRNCGDIAIHAGIAAGAEAIIVPEIDRTDEEWIEYVIGKLTLSRKRNKEYGIIVIAEGMHLQEGKTPTFTAQYVSDRINENFTPGGDLYEARAVDFAHVQRGGSPSASDRLLAATLGFHSVKVLLAGENQRCVGIRENRVYDMDISEAVQMKLKPRQDLIDIADILAR